jgi:hypothetical protein
MTPLSGSFTGKARLQTNVSLSDATSHELSLMEVTDDLSHGSRDGMEGSIRTGWVRARLMTS